MQKRCSSCESEFSCGNPGACWCSAYPPVLEVPDSEDCLCPSCLQKVIAKKIDDFVVRWRKERIPVPTSASKYPFLEEIDYYKEGDFVVFTAWYHIKRGRCCGNGCRHCPY